ncbi:MAG: hypothetical protein CMG35_12120 [Candidatus Marinimicrobia bacterium]|jgi:hypothetical protein|nr:hypothetical protein [Candidatus Neomarinimicrobiota bacterium]MBO03378.1 hypothetical protein [Candidatus Neomarinimicrobiota bacterium]|tara:strand:+ start:499 stop:1353 length:855 start_codon:yes stop_codon:yes gene_type:complete
MQKSRGALLIAKNNTQVDYIKQAVFLAKRIKKFLNIGTSVITDSTEYLESAFDSSIFDKVISLNSHSEKNERLYFDGAMYQKQATFKNRSRSKAFDLSPYYETLLLDTDYIISNNLLGSCFNSDDDFMIYKKSSDIAQVRNEQEFKYISDTGVPFYWATCVFFRKTNVNKIYFDLVKHIEEEWDHYRRAYQITSSLFRNDFAFSIAIHIMNGFAQGTFAKELPGKMLYTTDKDILWKLDDDKMMFLVEKKDYMGEYTALSTKGQTIHVMNKFSLGRMIDEVENV